MAINFSKEERDKLIEMLQSDNEEKKEPKIPSIAAAYQLPEIRFPLSPKTETRGYSISKGWTKDEEDRLKSLCLLGLTKEDLMAKFPGRTEGSIIQRIYLLRRFGNLDITPPKSKNKKEPKIPSIPRPSIWKAEDIEKMLIMLNEGKNILEISDALKRTKPSVAFKIVNMMNTDDFVVVFRKKSSSTQASQPVEL